MPNPYGRTWAELSREEYYNMDDDDKILYHKSRLMIARKEVKIAVLPRKAGQAPPKTDDQIRELREVSRFHGRQYTRISNNSKLDNYYSEEDENNRRSHVGIYDAVELREQTTEEMYDNYSREDKLKYWIRLESRQERFQHLNPNKYLSNVTRSASKERQRMLKDPTYTAPFDPEKSPSTLEYHDKKYRDSEYDDFTPEEKRKYHSRHMSRAYRAGNTELWKFHGKMSWKLTSGLPTLATPEEEQNG